MPFGYTINTLPEPHPIFGLIQKGGNISTKEMYKVFNMGIGFCVICSQNDADEVIDIVKKQSTKAYKIGYVVKDKAKKVIIEPSNLIGQDNGFFKYKKT